MNKIENVIKIGENDLYWFGVGLLDEAWYGFAVIQNNETTCRNNVLGESIFVLPGCDRWRVIGDANLTLDYLIRLTISAVDNQKASFGNIERWFVADDLRGTPTEFVCSVCGAMLCFPESHGEDWLEWSDD